MLVCSHGHGNHPRARTVAVATLGARAAHAAGVGAGEREGDTKSALADRPLLPTSRPWMDGSTSSYAAELGLVGVRERVLAVGQAARTDGADVDDLH